MADVASGNDDAKAVLNHALAGNAAALSRVVNPEGSVGIGGSTDNAVARFTGTAGALQDSGVIVDDSDNVSGIGTLACTGAATIGGACSLGGDATFTAAVVTPTITQTADATEEVVADDLGLLAQSASGVAGTGGGAFIQPGTGATANGRAEMRSANGTARIIVDTAGEITVAPNTLPVVDGLTVDAALIQLLAILDAYGWIDDQHVEV